MQCNTFEANFKSLWCRFIASRPIGENDLGLIRQWAIERGVVIDSVEMAEVGAFFPTKGVLLSIGQNKAFFPAVSPQEDNGWLLRRNVADKDFDLWEKLEWFSPLWMSVGKAREILDSVEYCDKDQALRLFSYHTSTIYNLAFQAICVSQVMPNARSLRDVAPLAREAYLGFYSGYRASSIAALIPALEGALTRIVCRDKADKKITEKIDEAIDRAIERAAKIHFDGVWVPKEYLTLKYLYPLDERVFAFESFRRWLKNSFFKKTTQYDGSTWLNRHIFAHGVSSDWQQSSNFMRLIVALVTMGVIEAWYDESNSVSLLFPCMNEDGELLHQQAIVQGVMQSKIKLMEQKVYQEKGRLVPEMPTDDGVLLRKAVLETDCINDLVRPLRNAGWQVSIGEPDENALYVVVTASCKDQMFNVALLYSCATDNSIYRALEEKCEAILYRGAPYNQNSYAYGVKVHVGPVAGWQPPRSSLLF